MIVCDRRCWRPTQRHRRDRMRRSAVRYGEAVIEGLLVSTGIFLRIGAAGIAETDRLNLCYFAPQSVSRDTLPTPEGFLAAESLRRGEARRRCINANNIAACGNNSHSDSRRAA